MLLRQSNISDEALSILCEEFSENNRIDQKLFDQYGVKRGLRNSDGTGVVAGLTTICDVHGYVMTENGRVPDHGRLIYRGIDVQDIVNGYAASQCYGFEETIWLLIFGNLPTEAQLTEFRAILAECRELPDYFAEDMIMKAPSPDIMNKLGRSVLALYSYDETPDDISLKNVMRQSLELIARLPLIMVYAYQVKRRHYDNLSMYFHPVDKSHSTAEFILSCLRPDRVFTPEEARLLDLCLILHAEHGGGNNSTFAARVLSSSGTDTYSAISAAIGSLKGPRHGGANNKVMAMMEDIKAGVKDWKDDEEVADFLAKIIRREAGDGSGLIYGMGHAVYTLSDPRAVILKANARKLAEEKGFGDEFALVESVERLSPEVFAKVKGDTKTIGANVDLYSGLVYKSLGFTEDLFTPIFAVSRMPGWCAHRIEEITTGGRIIRPAYKAVLKNQKYTNLSER